MIIDGRSVAAHSTLPADICIVGAGAAGITLALALADFKGQVLILESGGFEPEPAMQDLARGESIGQPYVPLETARLRCFGGSTMHWGGWCRPLEPIDFEKRPWVPHSGWPITRETLDPYYGQAQELCQLGEFDYDPADWDLTPESVLPLPPDRIRSRLIQFSPPTRFGVRYRDRIEKMSNTRVCLHTTVTQIVPEANGRSIASVRAATPAGNSFQVVAKRYIVACGGIDNARVLLASNEVMKNGVGNDNDLVGRFFADHIQLDTAGFVPADAHARLAIYQPGSRETRRARKAGGRGANVMTYLTLDPKVQEQRQTLNYSANVLQTSWSEYMALTDAEPAPDASMWDGMAHSLRSMWRNISSAAGAAVGSGGSGGPIFKIVTTQEQAPNPQSRVLLSKERDAFGMPRAALDWRLSELDRHSIEVGVDELVKAVGGRGIGAIHAPLELQTRGWPRNIPISWHHCGTTRMSDDPKQGVVDAHGRVHGIENLYVAGSSVFPTNGHGNPTLTIVALALRLGAELKAAL